MGAEVWSFGRPPPPSSPFTSAGGYGCGRVLRADPHSDRRRWRAVALDPADLAWNRSDERFWFHYSTRAAARAIATGGIYEVGDRHPKTPGLYVSAVHTGALGAEELLNALFDGTREIDRTQAAVFVFADGALTFERVQRARLGGIRRR